MALLNIVKTEPSEMVAKLIAGMSEGKETTRYDLYQEQDYDKLLELIFSHDEIISWW